MCVCVCRHKLLYVHSRINKEQGLPKHIHACVMCMHQWNSIENYKTRSNNELFTIYLPQRRKSSIRDTSNNKSNSSFILYIYFLSSLLIKYNFFVWMRMSRKKINKFSLYLVETFFFSASDSMTWSYNTYTRTYVVRFCSSLHCYVNVGVVAVRLLIFLSIYFIQIALCVRCTNR